MALEPIKRLHAANPDKGRVQAEAVASAETWTERHIARARGLDGAIEGSTPSRIHHAAFLTSSRCARVSLLPTVRSATRVGMSFRCGLALPLSQL